MPRRSLSGTGKPFEVKVGLGFQSFGGMYQLGDPSMCVPNRIRKGINVRLGGKDIASRAGLATAWNSTTGEPVVGMIEILNRDSGKIFFGPAAINHYGSQYLPALFDDSATTATMYYFGALIVDGSAPTAAFLGGRLLLFLPEKVPQQSTMTEDAALNDGLLGVGLGSGSDMWNQLVPWRSLAPIHRCPYVGMKWVGQDGGAAKRAHHPSRWYHIGAIPCPGVGHLDRLDSPYFSHEHIGEVLAADATYEWYGADVEESQWGNILDPPILFQGKWLAAGSIFGLQNPGIFPEGLTSGNPGTGQQVFELTLNVEPPSSPPPALLAANAADPTTYPASLLDNCHGGSLTQVFRMPGVSYQRIPTRAAGGLPDGKTIRSWCVRQVRNDNPITANQSTADKLYIGTFGGAPLLPGAFYTYPPPWPAGLNCWKSPIGTPTNGEVYSWDGSTLKLETTGLGPCVVVSCLPDGSILACGRAAAKLLDARDDTWKTVTYDPLAALVPRVYTTPPVNPARPLAMTPGPPDANYRNNGFLWFDRAVFGDTAYYYGIDTALLAPGAAGAASANLFQQPEGHAAVPIIKYFPVAEAVVIYRFDRATMKMIKVRDGYDMLDTVMANPPEEGYSSIEGGYGFCDTSPRCCLAVHNEKLYYGWNLAITAYAPDAVGNFHMIGTFDGSTWTDNYVDMQAQLPTVIHYVDDMLASAGGLYICCNGRIYQLIGSSVSLVGDISTINSYPGFNPGAYPQRMFLGPR